jgi:tetratricopeptide (TPR) repeat protein
MKKVSLALWLLLVLGGVGIERQHNANFAVLSGQQRERADVLLDVLGEFRTVMARYLWFKMDLFHEVLDDQGVASEQQTEVIPLLRMVSLLDPSMTDAFDIIAWDLYKGHRQTEQALKILDDGIARNQKSFTLYFRRALILYQAERYSEALPSALRAVELAQGEFDILNANRLLYWTASKTGDRELAIASLDVLLALRPQEKLWQTKRAELETQP